MKKTSILVTSIALLGIFPLFSCSKSAITTSQNNNIANSETGTLQVRANGEDFVRQGFISKDGWQISFAHIYVNLAEVQAYQTDPPYNAHSGSLPQAKETVNFVETKTVDLAAGDENAAPILVAEIQAPAGKYNALSWKMTPGNAEPTNNSPLVLIGEATKAGETINFEIKLNQELAFTCGDFVGEGRKGILQPGGTADLEATFHFDHLFGDGDSPADDEINTGALGFSPLANLAENNRVEEDMTSLKAKLSPEDSQKLQAILPSLGHVGEGHCHESLIGTSK